MRWLPRMVAGSVLLAAVGCSRAGDEAQNKRSPVPPPPQEVKLPAGLHIAVTVDGAAQPAIDAATLGAARPDYADAEHRAWKLTRLVPAFDRAGATILAHGQPGISVRLDRPATPGALEPVLFLTRRGELVATVLDPAEPFPNYHGQGGRLKRPGDPLPRVSPVTELAVVTGN